MTSEDQVVNNAKQTFISYLGTWGNSPFPPTLLATLVSALHLRPLQPLPLVLPPILLFSAYLNLNGFVVDSAGTTAAFSGLYFVLARRRKVRLRSRFGPRGLVRGAAMGVAGLNFVSCGMSYMLGRRKDEDKTL